MFRHEKDTLHVGGEYLVPFFLRNLFEIACKRLDACASIVAKNVKAPELSLDRFDHSNHASLDAYVALNQQRFRALRFALGRGLFRLTLAATVVDHHVVSCPRKSDGLGSTDARKRTSDQGDSLLFAHPDSPVCVESRFRSISRGRKSHPHHCPAVSLPSSPTSPRESAEDTEVWHAISGWSIARGVARHRYFGISREAIRESERQREAAPDET